MGRRAGLSAACWFFCCWARGGSPTAEVQCGDRWWKCSGCKSISAGSAPQGVILNATGYIVAAHKIEVAAKVIGQGEMDRRGQGRRVKEGEVLVRLEDDEYQAQLSRPRGSLTNLEAKLARRVTRVASGRDGAGAWPTSNTAKADLENARVTPGAHTQPAQGRVVAQQSAGRRAGALRLSAAPRQLAAEGLRTGRSWGRARSRSMRCAARWTRPAASSITRRPIWPTPSFARR